MKFFDKIKQGLEKTRKQMGSIIADLTLENGDFYDELEDALILADTGAETATKVVGELAQAVLDKSLRGKNEIREELISLLSKELEVGDMDLKLDTKPSVILMVGVNGVGKTTTIGKLAANLSQDKKVLLAAGDTFRAAAADQLTIWAERSKVDIIKHAEGADPGAVVFDAMAAGKARGADVIIIDTAGRLHNKQNLMNELAKIRKIITRELPSADVETLLVIDATTGQNGLIQAQQFAQTAQITGIVLTKLDGTAKGGIAFGIAKELKVPVKYIGVGEGIDDLMKFSSRDFVEALLP